ncbi:MAG: GntR family transcriptional regulator, partial [Nocardioides sp.]
YKELEADRVVQTEGRRGTFVKPSSVVAGAASESAASLVVAARQSGLTLAETLRLVEDAWS